MPMMSSGPMMTMNMLGHASGGGYRSQSASFTAPGLLLGLVPVFGSCEQGHVRILRGGLKSSPSPVTVGTPVVNADDTSCLQNYLNAADHCIAAPCRLTSRSRTDFWTESKPLDSLRRHGPVERGD